MYLKKIVDIRLLINWQTANKIGKYFPTSSQYTEIILPPSTETLASPTSWHKADTSNATKYALQ
jgi:hypothetical protein